MRHQLIVTLKPSRSLPEGRTLIVEYPDRDTAEAQLRCMERFRRARWGFSEIFLQSVDGERWCLSYLDIVWPVLLEPAEAAVAAG